MTVYSSDGNEYESTLHHELDVPTQVAANLPRSQDPLRGRPDAGGAASPLPEMQYNVLTTAGTMQAEPSPPMKVVTPPPTTNRGKMPRTVVEPQVQQDSAGFLSGIKNLIFGNPEDKGKTYTAPDNPPYPSKEDADFAHSARNAYGTGYEDYVYGNIAKVFGHDSKYDASGIVPLKKGETRFELFSPNTAEEIQAFRDTTSARAIQSMPPETREKLRDTFGRAALAVSRDPIASLGFSPKDTLIDALSKPEEVTTYGVTFPTTEGGNSDMYTNLGREMSSTVHESIHNGLNKLMYGLYPGDTETPKKYKEIENKFRYNSGMNDHGVLDREEFSEHLARYTMMTKMGDPEHPSEHHDDIVLKMKAKAKSLFEDSANSKAWQTFITDLRDLAARRIAEKRPGGPR